MTLGGGCLMANPQKEHGYTPVANEILEQLIKLPLNGAQLRIIVLVWRYTYGFSRKEHELSELFIVRATGLSKRFVSSELKKLIKLNLIKITKESTYTTPKTLAFNKDFDTWECGSIVQQVNDTSTVEQECTSTVEQSFIPLEHEHKSKNTFNASNGNNSEGEGLNHSPVEQSFTQENNNKTNNKTNGHEHFFESIWELYPYKKGKGRVSESKKKELFKIGFEQIVRCIERYKQTKEEWKRWQHGSTFFNSGFIDFLDKNFQQDEAVKDKASSHPEGFEVIR